MTDREREEHARCEAPRSVEEALARARTHGRAALAEAAAAARCLLDAASLAASGAPSEAHAGLRRASAWLERAEALAREGSDRGARWVEEVAAALDAEIARWESRSREDPEARAVLRAFLGVREVLWEVGLRPRSARGDADARESDATQAAPQPPARPLRRAGAGRLERVPVQNG
jgi:hypothetical protein